MSFSPENFERFCSKLLIDSKELGQTPLKFLGTQRYAINEIAKGLAEDIHSFVILKGRQLGVSTVFLALDLYWLFMHKGLQGAIVTDTDDNRALFRSYITQYMNSLPSTMPRPKVREHNRAQLILSNRSRLSYMVAGIKKKGELGRAKSVNFMQATECSSWGDEEGLGSLVNTLAQQHPARLYIFESTARGYNMFYQMWETAKTAKTERAIFIGWWRNELYQKNPRSVEYKTYWDGSPTSDERIWLREIWERYKVSITDQQLAWWRWYVIEKMKGDEILALQEMPPTEDYAFQLSGSKFFSTERINILYKQAREKPRRFFRYKFGMHFEQTEFIETLEQTADVSIWEPPDPNGVYVLGADPAYGSSEWADEFAICVLRCFADRVVQVAEVGTTEWTEAQFAWVVAHLAGNYKPCMVNLEMQGPGGAVFNELQNLKRYAGAPQGRAPDIYDVVGSIRDYLWRRQDSISGHYAFQWQTNAREKLRMFSTLRNYFERDMIDVSSPECAAQFRNIHREGDSVGGEGRAKDDRVVALAIAVIAWNDWIMHEMIAQNRTYLLETRPQEETKRQTPLEQTVLTYLNKNGIKWVQ